MRYNFQSKKEELYAGVRKLEFLLTDNEIFLRESMLVMVTVQKTRIIDREINE